MKRDPHISKLIKESGVISAPGSLTSAVMDNIEAIPVKKPYKPLIGRGGRILIIFFIIAIVVIAVLYANPSSTLVGQTFKIPQVELKWPQIHLNLDFLQQINFSRGVAAALVALFILILSDAGLRRRKLMQ